MFKMFNLHEKIMYGAMILVILLKVIIAIINGEWNELPTYGLFILVFIAFYLQVLSMYNNYVKPVKEGKK
jgi:hypothetical protein